MELTDDELRVVAKALGAFVKFLHEENDQLLAIEGHIPEAVHLAAHNILQENLAPVTDLQIRLSKHFGMPNMPTG